MSPAAAAQAADEESFSLAQIVADLAPLCNYSPVLTRERLLGMAKRNSEINEALLVLGARQAVRSYVSSERRAASTASSTDDEEGPLRQRPVARGGTVEQIFEQVERRLFWDRYTLFGALPIRQATHLDLKLSIENRRTQAGGNLVRADFEAAILRRMPKDDKKRVSDVLDAAMVEKIKSKFQFD